MSIKHVSHVAAVAGALIGATEWKLPSRVAAQGQDLPARSGSGVLPEHKLPPGLPSTPERRPSPSDYDTGRGSSPVDALSFENVRAELLREARSIENPNEKALAFIRMANAAISSDRLGDADDYLHEAVVPAREAETSLLRDQRAIAIVNSLFELAEHRLRAAKVGSVGFDPDDPRRMITWLTRDSMITKARDNWRLAADLAAKLENPTYRCDQMYLVVDSLAFGAQTIGVDILRPTASNELDSRGRVPYNDTAYTMLNEAADLSMTIPWPVWRDRALVKVAGYAAAADQFSAGLRAARRIPQPEVRVDGLLKVAEAQSKSDRPQDATETYLEAAVAVSSIPLDDPRAVLTGVLIDNLIAVGRFEDARACVDLYPDQPRRLIALGAIAKSQGQRGNAESARAWISRDIAPRYRSELYRRVNDGILSRVDLNRVLSDNKSSGAKK